MTKLLSVKSDGSFITSFVGELYVINIMALSQHLFKPGARRPVAGTRLVS